MIKSEITIELLDLYKTYADQINISAKMSTILHGLRDIKASGNEVEISLRNVISELIPNKYNTSNGHIIDSELNVSKQYDIVITENIDYKAISKVKDSTELFFYETIFALGECKVTWNQKSIKSSIDSIKDLRARLSRNMVSNKTIFSGNSAIELESEITSHPYRNPLFFFAFAIKTDSEIIKLKNHYKVGKDMHLLPNITIILNEGVFVLLNKKKLDAGIIAINLYPEFAVNPDEYVWKFISSSHSGKNLSYLLFCLLEHLSNSILEKPPYMTYASSIWKTDDADILDLNDL